MIEPTTTTCAGIPFTIEIHFSAFEHPSGPDDNATDAGTMVSATEEVIRWTRDKSVGRRDGGTPRPDESPAPESHPVGATGGVGGHPDPVVPAATESACVAADCPCRCNSPRAGRGRGARTHGRQQRQRCHGHGDARHAESETEVISLGRHSCVAVTVRAHERLSTQPSPLVNNRPNLDAAFVHDLSCPQPLVGGI